MRTILDTTLRSTTAVAITWIILAGVAYAGTSCCRLLGPVCPQTLDKSLYGHSGGTLKRLPSSHLRLNQPPGIKCSEELNPDSCDASPCCETSRCDMAAASVYHSVSQQQHPYPSIEKAAKVIQSGEKNHFPHRLKGLQTHPRIGQIFILTQSIIC